MQINIELLSHLSDEVVSEIKKVIQAATVFDEMAPLSEHVLIHLNQGGDEFDEHFLAKDSTGKIIGYLHLDRTDEVAGPIIEVVVHPDSRNNGIGAQLVNYATQTIKDSRMRLWAHGELGGAYALAKKLGFAKSRELWQMRRSLYAELPKLELPSSIQIKNFSPEENMKEFLILNSIVFEKHPEQGRLDEKDFKIRMSEAWFRSEGFFLAQDQDKKLIGFNWTKIHGQDSGPTNNFGHQKIGEIYVLGVKPGNRQSGLGKALAIRGLEYLREQGLGAAMLYVDRTNVPAIKLYESIGFAHWDTDVMFQKQIS